MGGKVTFVGKWQISDDMDYNIMKLLHPIGEINKEVLPSPFDAEEIYGPILIVKMDENVEPADMTLEEYDNLKKLVNLIESEVTNSINLNWD